MAQEQLYESCEFIFDAENQSLSDDKLSDLRFEEEEEDELTRKIKAIPILPRIPKIKKSGDVSDEESTKRRLEYRSVLHRKEFFMNTEDTLKWPSADINPYDRQRKRTFSHISEKKTSLELTNGPFTSRARDIRCLHPDRKRLNDRNLSNGLTAEEKFDQIKLNNDSKIKPNPEISNSIPEKSCHSLEGKTSNEFDHFESSLLNNVPMKPYKTLEERRLERIRNGLLKSTVDSVTSSKTLNIDDNVVSEDNSVKQMSNNGEPYADAPNSSKEASVGEGSGTSSDLDSHTEVIDMEIANSPCERTLNKDSSLIKLKSSSYRKVTFDCPEKKEAKVSNSTSGKDVKKKHEHTKKSSCQEQVILIMKDFLKPFYSKQKISKEDYKEIMRKIVPKFSKSKSEEIKRDKIEKYAEKYVKMLIHKKKKA